MNGPGHWELKAFALARSRCVAPAVACLAFLCLASVGCGATESAESVTESVDQTPTVQATFTSIQHDEHNDRGCSGTFVAHELDHVTAPRGVIDSDGEFSHGEVSAMVDGTGAGVYADDLDDDGQIDLVLPNLTGDTNIFWGNGDLTFTKSALESGRFRQAIAADVDHDGDRDLLLSTGIGPPVAFLNAANAGQPRQFERREFRTTAVTYSMAAGDLDGDGRIEIATGSYNAELTQNRDNRVLTGNGVGTAIHRPTADNLASGVETEFLTAAAQALATMIVDIDGDGLQDVLAGNDLGTPDRVWLGDKKGLTITELFDSTSLSTMSLDVADLDRDGGNDLFSTDMAALADEPDSLWEPVRGDIEQARVDEIQQPRNVLQLADGSRFTEQATEVGIAATGWSWSGLLGDLDDDGHLDVYVVNGMRATTIFEDLPNGELVEPNQAFRNTAGSSAADRDSVLMAPAPEWGLDATAGGRGMAQADLDSDGDLDIIINNLASPAVVWENQLCAGRSIVVEPIWTGAQNVDALGTKVVLTVAGEPADVARSALITGSRGYISTSATQAHFGLGTSDTLAAIQVVWPDGTQSRLADVSPGTTVRVERSSGASS